MESRYPRNAGRISAFVDHILQGPGLFAVPARGRVAEGSEKEVHGVRGGQLVALRLGDFRQLSATRPYKLEGLLLMV